MHYKKSVLCIAQLIKKEDSEVMRNAKAKRSAV
jgi:hypothetical protein